MIVVKGPLIGCGLHGRSPVSPLLHSSPIFTFLFCILVCLGAACSVLATIELSSMKHFPCPCFIHPILGHTDHSILIMYAMSACHCLCEWFYCRLHSDSVLAGIVAASYEVLEKEVYKDVLRTDRNLLYYRGDDNQNMKVQL